MKKSTNPTSSEQPVLFERERGVTEVQIQREVTRVVVLLPAERQVVERLRVLKALAAAEVPIDLLKLQPGGFSFVVQARYSDLCEKAIRDLNVPVQLLRDCALVSPLAGAMRDLSGVMAGIYEALVSVEIPILQTGDAYHAVHCLVEGKDADRAAESLRRVLLGGGA